LRISIPGQYIEVCKPHIGIIADQEKQILKFLYLGVCIGGFRRIYIDKEIVDKLILRVIKRGYFSSKVNDSFPVGFYIFIYFGEVITYGEVYILLSPQLLFDFLRNIRIVEQTNP